MKKKKISNNKNSPNIKILGTQFAKISYAALKIEQKTAITALKHTPGI